MPSLTIKNLPDAVYRRLKRSAADQRRSLNSEVIHRLEQAVGIVPVEPGALIAHARLVREKTDLPYLTDTELRHARDRGRS